MRFVAKAAREDVNISGTHPLVALYQAVFDTH